MYRCSDSCSVATLQHPYRMKHKAIHIVLERASASVSTALHCTISIDGKYNVHIWKKNAPIKQYDLPLECITMHSAFTLHVSIYTHTSYRCTFTFHKYFSSKVDIYTGVLVYYNFVLCLYVCSSCCTHIIIRAHNTLTQTYIDQVRSHMQKENQTKMALSM